MSDRDTLGTLAALAREAGSPWIATETEALADRLAEGRFYVVCVGQFKRGKSTLLNALAGLDVLPIGVVPITAAVTLLRYGDSLGARIRFRDRDWEECDPRTLAHYVSEEHNPGNEKEVTAVEVFAPSPLLRSGMCLVDTPGIGSISLANTEATRAFVPHFDVTMVVLGADPPITGEELGLVREVGRTVPDVIVVFNKADRQPDAERAEAVRFTSRVLDTALERSVGPILQVSATERLSVGPTRDWNRLVERLEALARDSGAVLVRATQSRETRALVERLLHELDEQRAALLRPVSETEARVDALRHAVADAERALGDLSHLLIAEQQRLSRQLTSERDGFFARTLPNAQRELGKRIHSDPDERDVRARALEHARQVTKASLDRWRDEQAPRADALYREAERRFVELVNTFQERLTAIPGLPSLPLLHAHQGLRATSRFYYTEMMRVTAASPATWLQGFLPWRRREVAERDAQSYLEELLHINSARIKNDVEERALQSRRALETEVRDRLHSIVSSAQHALESAREAQRAGAAAVQTRLAWIDGLRQRAAACVPGSEWSSG